MVSVTLSCNLNTAWFYYTQQKQEDGPLVQDPNREISYKELGHEANLFIKELNDRMNLF